MSHPLKVLFINDTARNGGPGRSLRSFVTRLTPARIHRTVLLPRPGPVADGLAGGSEEIVFERAWVENIIEPWHRPIEREDFDVALPVRLLRLVGNLGRMTFAIARTARRVSTHDFDLIYCNGTIADFVGGLVAWWTERPVVWHVRYTSIPKASTPLHRWLAREVVTRIVCVSHAAAALFPEQKHKVAVINNAVDLEEFSPGAVPGCLRQELGLSADTVIFGSHGRVLRKKGFIEMIEAAAIALGRLSSDERARIHFVVVGDTPQDFHPDHVAECVALARDKGLDKNVTFLGFKADVRPYVIEFDVAIVPSVYPDPLPRAVIESMALGKPVIAFAVGGVAEMLSAAQGALVRGTPPDVNGLADEIVRWARDPALRARAGVAARDRVEDLFDARKHAQKIEDVILAAAATRRNHLQPVAPAPASQTRR